MTPSAKTGSKRPTQKRVLIWLLVGYLALLGLSHLVRLLQPDPWQMPDGMQTLPLKPFGKVDDDSADIQIRYFDIGSQRELGRDSILVIHGSPVAASSAFKTLMQALSRHGRVIMPDLPGFGYSTRRLPDYGFEAHADYLAQLIEGLALDRAHLVAYSMGGGAALHLAANLPQKIASLTLLSSIGVQELELMGDYHINHALHAVQLLFFWGLQELTPHMGWLDRFPLNRNYARQFFASDQRPLRALLYQLVQPTLIVHSENDRFVPLAAAREHHRLVAQSELDILPGGHLLVFRQPQQIAEKIADFIVRVETDRAPARPQADPQRLAAAQIPFAQIQMDAARGMQLLMYVLMIALATLISEDLACIAAGLMAAKGLLGYFAAAGAALGGIVVGDLLLFLAGKYLGRPAVHKRPLRWFVKPNDLDRAAHWFRARGPAIIISSRFLPGSRLPTYVAAGIIDGRVFFFLFYFLIAAILWTPALVGAAMGVGNSLLAYYDVYQRYAVWVVIGALLLFWMLLHLVVPMFSFRGRRMLLAAYRRKCSWQSWPFWLTLLPVTLFILLRSLRLGHPTLFTAANPAMPGGGFAGVSKAAMLSALEPSGKVPPQTLIDQGLQPAEQLARVRRFMEAHDEAWPLVVKPDRGRRGRDVAVIRDQDSMQSYLKQARFDILVQPQLKGREFGVFYCRYPDQAAGQILALTEKRMLTLSGDGEQTLETLILKDDRALWCARRHFDTHRQRLYQIPAAGEKIILVEVGTRERGAVFADATDLVTPAMTRTFDRISRLLDGFYVGRFDVRTTDVAAFKLGRHFTILEVNGVTSESIEIYDPDCGLFQAWRRLNKQWQIILDIGAANHHRGKRAMAPLELIKLVLSR